MIEEFLVYVLGKNLYLSFLAFVGVLFSIVIIPVVLVQMTRFFDYIYNWSNEKKNLEREIDDLKFKLRLKDK
jgi:hypothetical protein